jgi:hypothetical protein
MLGASPLDRLIPLPSIHPHLQTGRSTIVVFSRPGSYSSEARMIRIGDPGEVDRCLSELDTFKHTIRL